MKTVRMSRVVAGIVGAASLFLVIPVSLSGDVFYRYTGERVSGSYQRAPETGTEGKGFEVFNIGGGVKIDDFQKAYVGTSMGAAASDGWDIFHVRQGDPLP